MKITHLEPFIIHAPVTRGGVSDSTHSLTHWGAPGVIIHTDTGLRGFGYTGTHAHLPSDRLITECITESYGPLLIGEDPIEVRGLWSKMINHSETQWVGRAGITQLAISAIDLALWDLKAKALQLPLWKVLGGSPKEVEAYNTDGGWLNFSQEQLVEDCLKMTKEEGYRSIKLKVGKDNLREDYRRVSAVREAVGPDVDIMIDANGRWTLPKALRAVEMMKELDIVWVEEPISFDDVEGHRQLASKSPIPIALGEQLYSSDHFQQFIHRQAVHFVQADAVRLAGITEWWQVAELAHSYRLPVVSHVGDMCQVHLQLAIAHPSCSLLEFIPWLQPWMKHPVEVQQGFYKVPQEIGAGTEFSQEALDSINVI